MKLCRRSGFHLAPLPLASLTFWVLTGCASPGLPRPPSLQIPAPAKDLNAVRRANTVYLRFTLPHNTTDNQPLHPTPVKATVCRSIDSGPCKLTPATGVFPMPATLPAEISDPLPTELTSGKPHFLTYRVRLANLKGRFGEWSQPAETASGSAPPEIHELNARGSRLGIVLLWRHEEDGGSKVILRREDTNPTPPKLESKSDKGPAHARIPAAHKTESNTAAEPNIVSLDTGVDSATPAPMTLDTTALAGEPYRYTAERVRTVTIGSHSLELHSSMSGPLPFTLRDVFPPLVPTDLSIVGFATQGQPGVQAGYAVDLIWQPVDDANLAGYNVYRQLLNTAGTTNGRTKLNQEPVTLPAFHDPTADPRQQYLYSVTAIDRKGNESAAITATLSAQPQ